MIMAETGGVWGMGGKWIRLAALYPSAWFLMCAVLALVGGGDGGIRMGTVSRLQEARLERLG